jgi:hypothetical protein
MSEVELKDFIRDALVQIATGIREANSELKKPDDHQYDPFILRQNTGDYSKIPGIRFDVAVTAGTKQQDKAHFFVFMANIGGGANTEKAKSDELYHRIQFEVGLDSTWQ